MCFSAEASFAASGLLATSSVAIARLPKEKAGVPLSLFPAVFAAHQFVEGLLWLEHDGVLPPIVQPAALYTYALIAYVLWPMLVPFAAYRLESSWRRRALILLCQAAGLAVGLTFLVSVLRHPLGVLATCCGLTYHVDAPDLLLGPYLFAVSVPFLASSRRGLVLFGVAVTVSSAAAAFLVTADTFPSVWCFFAAALSAGLYFYFRQAAHSPGRAKGDRITHLTSPGLARG